MQAPRLHGLLTLGEGLFCYAPERGSQKEFDGTREIQALLKLPLACLNEERGFVWDRLEFEAWLCHSLAPGPWAATYLLQVCLPEN